MSLPINVLVAEDSEDDAILMMRELRRSGYASNFVRIDTPEAMRAALGEKDWDVVISDYAMPRFNAFDALKILKESGLDIPFIIVSGTIGEDLAVAAMRAGAHDYVMKDKLARLGPAVQRELQEAEVRRARRLAEAEKEKMQEQLHQAQKMEAIGILAAGVAHDFNNLLTTVQGFTDLAMTKIDESHPSHEDLQQVLLAAMRASDLTRQLLIFSSKQPMELNRLNINRIIRNLLKMLNRLIGEDIVIETELEPDIWTIRADAGKIEQVIMNLAVNARDAMPDGGKLIIKTANMNLDEEYCKMVPDAQPGNSICLSVTDTGVGIAEEYKPFIFDPFFTTKEEGKGTGLGLSVVFGIIKQHDGCISFYSEKGQGTTFKVYIPAIQQEAEDLVEEAIPLEELQGDGKRILLVEDDKAVREFTAQALNANGYFVTEAEDMQQALEIFEQEAGQFELILSDVVLPDRNGLELVTRILAIDPNVHVLLTSGYTDHKSRWNIISERDYNFLAKPYTLPNLLRAAKEAIEKDTKAE